MGRSAGDRHWQRLDPLGSVCNDVTDTQDPVFSIANFEFESAAWNWSPEGQKEKQEQNESLLARNQGTGISATR